MTSTTKVRALTFELQMAEQAQKFGARLRELRDERGWKARDVVAKMGALGDLSLNTNQLSRYENGGAFPGEVRLERFAQVLGTDVADLMAGPPDQRSNNNDNDLMGALAGAEQPSLQESLEILAEGQRELLEGQAELQKSLAALQKQLERDESGRTGSGSSWPASN